MAEAENVDRRVKDMTIGELKASLRPFIQQVTTATVRQQLTLFVEAVREGSIQLSPVPPDMEPAEPKGPLLWLPEGARE